MGPSARSRTRALLSPSHPGADAVALDAVDGRSAEWALLWRRRHQSQLRTRRGAGEPSPYAAVVVTDDARDRVLVPSRQTVRPVQCPKMRVFRSSANRDAASLLCGDAETASKREQLRTRGSALGRPGIHPAQPTYRRHSACVTPSVACGLGRASAPPTPASPPRRKRLSWRAKRLRLGRHREVASATSAPLPSSGVSAASLPVPKKPHPRGRTPA